MADEIQVWQPTPFEGTDLLPVQAEERSIGPADVPVVQEHDVEASDIRLPQVVLLQGTSKIVQNAEIDGAQPGKLYFTGNGELLKPPVRFIVIHRYRGNAMFVRGDDPAYHGLEDCISRDGVTGTKYGDCESCKRCTEWRTDEHGVENQPPLGSKTQQFVVWLKEGIGILRIALSNKHAEKNTKDFMTRRATTGRNWFAHPTVARVEGHTNKNDEPYKVLNMRWDESQVVPDDLQRAAFQWYRRVVEALEQGTLTEDEVEPGGHEASAPGSPPPPQQDHSDIPF